jgi:hypothetical protein
MVKFQRRGKTTLSFLPSTFKKMGGFHEEEKQDESIESSAEEKECEEILKKIKGREEVSHLIKG